MRISIRPWRYEHFIPPVVAEAMGRFLQTTEASQHLGSAPHQCVRCSLTPEHSGNPLMPGGWLAKTGRTTNRPHECVLPLRFSPQEKRALNHTTP